MPSRRYSSPVTAARPRISRPKRPLLAHRRSAATPSPPANVGGAVVALATRSACVDMNDSLLLSADLPPLDSSCNLPLDVPFTAAVARAAGVSQRTLRLWCRLGLLRPPIRGVYVAGQVPDSLVMRAHAWRSCVPDDAVICDRHAGWLLGAEMVLAPNEHLRSCRSRCTCPRATPAQPLPHSGERRLRPEDITEVLGHSGNDHAQDCLGSGRVRSRERAISAHGPDAAPARLPSRCVPRRGRAVPGRALGHHLCECSPLWPMAAPSRRRSRSCACTGSTPVFPGRCPSSRSGSTAS